MMQVRGLSIDVQYDKDYDILYVLVGEPAAATSEPVIEGIYIRREALTGRIAGAIIEQYSHRNIDFLRHILPLPVKIAPFPQVH